MQIIDLYIRGGNKFTSDGYFPASTRLVDTSTDFTNGNFSVGQIIKDISTGIEGKITAIAPNGNDTLDISGGIFSGLKTYQIYDDFTKLELFNDESVSITDTIQNVKDPAKIFAPFSQQFSVPASKHNNKFFKHYYDVDVNNSFDARYQGDGLIQLNGVNYKSGKMRLTSVDLKNNVAYSYKLVFTGETVEFKELLAENELSSLTYPDSLNFVLTNDFVRNKFIGTAEGDDLIFPLITHSKNMRYKNGKYKDHITDNWINFADLKPALKTKVIIDAIETTYPQIKFSEEFFNSPNFRKLYMWLHREEGFLSNSIEGGGVQNISNLFFQPVNTGNNYERVSGDELRVARPRYTNEPMFVGYIVYEFYLTVTTNDPNQSYDVQILRGSNSATLFEESGTGLQTFRYDFTPQTYGEMPIISVINISAENTVGISQSLLVKEVFDNGGGQFTTLRQCVYEKDAPASENTITISRQIPKMKIFDFLKNLFLMYNLTAYKEDGVINVLPLDDYYNAGVSYDITEYVDTSKSSVSKLLQFKNMVFDFKSKKSFLVQYAEELQGNVFAQESYGNDEWDGSNYKIELDFEKMMYERLSDEADGTLTTIGQGAMLDKKFEPTIGKPLLFYAASTSTSTTNLLWDNLNNTLEGIDSYLRPSNSISNTTTGFLTETLNFGVEIDEYTLGSGTAAQLNQSNDLFTKYYRNYVANLFARNSRKTKVSAYLPLNIILKYKLNDIFIIGKTEYRINSIKTNLLTNKSDLELYNLQADTRQQINGQIGSFGRVEGLEVTSQGGTSIGLQWGAITDPNFDRYDIYLNNEFLSSETGTSKTITALENKTTYKISLRAVYTVGSNEGSSFDSDIFINSN
ncbi:fibronectin type III domain-containing protein [Akkermansiaceae bacterium]|nr:fibronectin type III domain-containing protein [Akkermansiaceae bacterium]